MIAALAFNSTAVPPIDVVDDYAARVFVDIRRIACFWRLAGARRTSVLPSGSWRGFGF
jgi:hypothetical protein